MVVLIKVSLTWIDEKKELAKKVFERKLRDVLDIVGEEPFELTFSKLF